MTGYSSKITDSSSKLSPREQLRVKDPQNHVSMDAATAEGQELVISPAGWAVVEIHNEKADHKDYTKYVVIDKDGITYVTGSTSFWESFTNIWDTMQDAAGEAETDDEAAELMNFQIKVTRHESKNYKGKTFISCMIL